MPVTVYTQEEVDQAIATALANLPPGQGGPSIKVPVSIEFFRNSGTPLLSAVSSAWAFPGAALSASMHMLNWQLGGMGLAYARFLVTWTPGHVSSPTGVRLIHADGGPTNIAQIKAFEQAGLSPTVSAWDITTDIQALIAAGPDKFLGLQTRGNGSASAKIYSALIETVWN